MTEPVTWRADGVPLSERFGDIYHTETGALAQSRHVFLGGCGLPGAWAGRPQWRILETGFGFGLNFLATWQAWRDDPARPALLHFVSIEAYPVGAEDLRRATAAYPELHALAEELAAQWLELLPGFHRLAFDGGRVLLTVCVGDVQAMLKAQRFEADSLFLDGFSPVQNPDMWSPDTLKAVSRFARRGTGLATWTIARAVRDTLSQLGFQVRKAPGFPPKRDCLRGVFDPAWTPRQRTPSPSATTPGRCAVIGAGLAGAAVAASLARRGWQVEVLERAGHAAAGASGLPVGLLAPHVSSDDALLSRLTRAGIRATWQQLEDLLVQGRDWRASGVLERRPAVPPPRLPPDWTPAGPNLSWQADAPQIAAAGLPTDAAALWHGRAGWVKPAALVAAWLAQPGVRLRTQVDVARLAPSASGWQLFDAEDRLVAEAERVVVAAGFDSLRFAPALPLQPVRGQVAWGTSAGPLAATPVNGDGHLIPQVPGPDGTWRWLSGATYERGSTDTTPREADHAANRAQLERLHPATAAALADGFDQATPWAGIRCASADRRPLVGPLAAEQAGLWVCTALGSRGLSFAALCAELLAAQWHGEPLPLSNALAKALSTQRR
ncbi:MULTISPECIES: FAD-dependent 5-carboxymethylaminomethyl-2-thiouridine(34) oxidoreductase MnmC [unclassified Variovorax]|uniref:FAD-dependent 5-carboxymethylaminomethyl-2-thiouridine(34) oxidoreductase MnmC n=1 Tax=unclassified Variovorax TaxID=663243 RepID=UPI002576797D|nr:MULTISPECIES: FAD-dependent 5-carboxymethylaminomethyl-2-thiouridine(34) oxidoreductase MnmC [unclassified Variovorax]MDM0089162.1 FAD-dependent 5-carboxymethylaminomethyl-2-thiouridine(34) oxidoreductase MnmC [Variovorax sp. J22G40]MDM0147235.1 FAD-dependent 5-carboxymethylaminomethyl-2-thiouridine(34) oxidoreductase MnmC [Variovorax sp. J2P1-31]